MNPNRKAMCAVTRRFAVFLVALVTMFAAVASAQTLGWKKLNLLGNLPPRSYFASAYDPISKNVVVFGGVNQFSQLDETWLYDGQTWKHAVEYVHPSARASAGMVYDAM